MIFQHIQLPLPRFLPLVSRRSVGLYRGLLVGLVLGIGLVDSALAGELARSQAELQELDARIEALRSKLETEKSEQESLTDELDRIELRLSRLDKAMRQSRQKKTRLETRLDDLESESKRLQVARSDATQRLGALLRSGYLLGKQSGLRMLVNQQDPHSAARRMAMFRYVIEARNTQLAEIAALAEQVADNRQQIITSRAELEQTLVTLEADERQLEQDKQARAEQIALLKKAMLEGGEQLNIYTKRQERLEELLVALRRPKIPKTPEKSVETKSVFGQLKPAEPIHPSLVRRKPEPAPAPRPVPRAGSSPQEESDEEESAGQQGTARQAVRKPARDQGTPQPTIDIEPPGLPGGFANNKGALPPPLLANVEARFGEARSDSGLSWQGVLFGATNGQAVRVVYPGQVVFSDWFRGYGKLMVVDHGDGYMSLYGHNQVLNARVGDSVAAGQVIASANDAASVPVPGLYFEIRHNGLPDDPLQWIR